jgi:hypothetical protein
MRSGSDHCQDKDKPQVEQVGFSTFFSYDVYVLKWFTYDDILLNPWWLMKQQWSVRLNSWGLSKRLWNIDRVLNECWVDDENVNVLKWPIWGGYIIALRRILNWLWDVDLAFMNLGCRRMVVWVLRRIYYCILLNVIMTNGCMSITKDLPLYFIECNYDEWLYEYYEGSTVVFYWM